jgi:23S rRNA pseudouridine2457 synthase
MLVALSKPCGVLCQFNDAAGRPTLADYVTQRDGCAAGYQDRESEGLRLHADDGDLALRLADPRHK